jgi:hypothetical protein
MQMGFMFFNSNYRVLITHFFSMGGDHKHTVEDSYDKYSLTIYSDCIEKVKSQYSCMQKSPIGRFHQQRACESQMGMARPWRQPSPAASATGRGNTGYTQKDKSKQHAETGEAG